MIKDICILALLLNNKAEFILNIDWTQSRIIFISPVFSTYQRKAIEFKDLPIELWEIKQYYNNIISLIIDFFLKSYIISAFFIYIPKPI
ncbi:MAG TPA: hypothetical protein VEW92_10065 [Nitrososphaeraceae archaeon]|nr:hypothetical protein [Nitrososphaeraceae archaeon]